MGLGLGVRVRVRGWFRGEVKGKCYLAASSLRPERVRARAGAKVRVRGRIRVRVRSGVRDRVTWPPRHCGRRAEG